MGIITLTSDWGSKGYYAGAVKGVIYSHYPQANVVDITHDIPHFDIQRTAFVLRNAYRFYPVGTVHLIGVNSEADIDSPHVIVHHRGHYFIGADNGVFSLLLEVIPDKIIELNVMQDTEYYTFTERDLLAKVAAQLASGKAPEDFGSLRTDMQLKLTLKPVIDKDLISAVVMFVDGYENLITNVTQDLFKEVGKGRPFTLSLANTAERIRKLCLAYSDKEPGGLLAFFNADGYLEIAMNMGNASGLLNMHIGDSIRIEFESR